MSGEKQRPLLCIVGMALGGAGLLALASCGGGQRERVRPPSARVSKAVPLSAENSAALSAPDRFVALASSQSMFAIQASEIAVTRAADYRLRAAADTIAHDQLGISAQVSFAGRRLNLLPSATMAPRHQAMLGELRAATNFDATYRRQMSEVLGSAWALNRAYAVRGSSPTLRPVAAMAAPLLGRELASLRKR